MVGLRVSELTYDFHRPITAKAITRFDPELRLVLNRRRGTFVIMRLIYKTRHFYLEGFGSLAFIEPVLIHVCDWKEGLQGRDDPYPILHMLWESDTYRHPRLVEDGEAAIFEHKRRMAQKVHEEYRHATAENIRQLARAWEPFMHSPSLVR